MTYTYADGAGDKVNRSKTTRPDRYCVSYASDLLGRRTTKTVYPELDYETLTYDARNNPLTLTLYPKPGSPEDIAGKTVVKAMAYTEGPTVADCVSILTCNKPAWSKSPNLFVTNYYWFSSGLLSKIKLPADSAGYRPETDFAYSTFGADGFSLLTSKTQWVTYTPSIVKTVTGYTYNASNFYVPQTVSVDPTGLNLVTTLSYDGNGDVTQLDGPRTDVTDISYFTYDNDRRNVFAISPDPDGAGSHPRVATKKTYDVDGRLFETDRGTTTSILATDFAINDWVKDLYDPDGNKASESTGDPANGTKLATQFAYDGANRVLCTARRMNTATFASLPADGCALAPSGIYGADRIVKTIYDAAGQARQEVRGFGTPIQQTYATHTYTPNGKESSVYDADGAAHVTTYSYDGFDRLNKTTYADNTADQVTLFDSDGNVRIRLNRSGQTLSYTYDRNDRVLTRAMTGGATATWVYDLLNEVTSLSDAAGNALANTYDLAGRQLTASQTLPGMTGGAKTVTYTYDDGAGDKVNRSRIAWPDGYYVNYGYDALSHMTTAVDSDGTALATRTYDNLARPATTQYPNASDNISYAWTPQDELQLLTDGLWGTANDVSFTNSFTPAHQIAGATISNTLYKYSPPASGTDVYAAANGLNHDASMTPARVSR